MPKIIGALLLIVSAFIISAPTTASADMGDWSINGNLLFGRRVFGEWDNNAFDLDMEELKTQKVYGAEIDFGKDSWPINIWLGVTTSNQQLSISESDFDSDAYFSEVFVGARVYFFGLFASVGIADIGGKYSGDYLGDSYEVTIDREIGLLLNTGIKWTFVVATVGLDLRALSGTDYNDYIMISGKMGFSF